MDKIKRLAARLRNGADWGPLGVPSLDKTWYCHGCGESMRFPLKGPDGTTTGCPTCKSCGRPMVTDIQLKDRDAPRRRGSTRGRTGQLDPGPLPGASRRDSMTWYCHDCGTSKRHPLAEGAPGCVSCGRPMVTDRHLKGR
jgi:RNase P subunit RPR2